MKQSASIPKPNAHRVSKGPTTSIMMSFAQTGVCQLLESFLTECTQNKTELEIGNFLLGSQLLFSKVIINELVNMVKNSKKAKVAQIDANSAKKMNALAVANVNKSPHV